MVGRVALGLEKVAGLGGWLKEVKLDGDQGRVEAWCEEQGVSSLKDVQKRSEDLAGALGLVGEARVSLGLEKIAGLSAWLKKVQLEGQLKLVEGWCEKKKIVKLEEVEKGREDLAEALSLSMVGRVA